MLKLSSFAALAAVSVASVAFAQSSYSPVAFGPLGATDPGTFYTFTNDISADGRYVLATLNNGESRYITPGGTYRMSGTGFPVAISGDGQTVVGGQIGSNPQRWRLANAVGNSIASQNITWPGGPTAFGPGYGTNFDASVTTLLQPGVSVVGSFGRRTAQSDFSAINIAGTAGAYSGNANNVPVVAIAGSLPGNPTNMYRWNYSTGAISSLNLPAGASSINVPNNNSSISSDAGVIIGNVSTRPYWWDSNGNPQAMTTLGGSILSSVLAVNGSGTLAGGFANFPLQVRHAFITSLQDNTTYDLHLLAFNAGLLPAGWTLTATQQISDDGSRIFCLATDPTGTTRSVLLNGVFTVPSPSSLAVLGLAGLAASRRRRA